MDDLIPISVLMSAYNEEKWISDSINSILSQTYKNFEFIIVNDGSTDNTLKILEKYKKKDKRIKIINQKNVGLTKALNNGLKYCNGKYIARMDANDIALPSRFSKQVAFLESHPECGVVGTWRKEFWPGKHRTRIIRYPTKDKEIKRKIMNFFSIGHSTAMIKTCVLKKYRYNEKFKYSQDYALWINIAKEYKLANIPEILMNISRLDSSLTNSKNKIITFRYGLKIRFYAYLYLDIPWWYFIYLVYPFIILIIPKSLMKKIINLKLKVKK